MTNTEALEKIEAILVERKSLKLDLIQLVRDLNQVNPISADGVENDTWQYEAGVIHGKLIASNYLLEILEKYTNFQKLKIDS